MKSRYIIASFVAAIAFLAGCAPDLKPVSSLDGLEVSNDYFSLTADEGSSATITVQGKEPWAINIDADWLSATPASGAAGQTITVTFNALSKAVANRKTEVKIVMGDKTKILNVNQIAENIEPVVLTVKEAVSIVQRGEQTDATVRVKGIVCKINEISTSYGNATYFLSDDGTFKGSYDANSQGDGNWLEIYRGYWLKGAKFTKGDEFSVGDELVIEGVLMSYKGTPETVEYTASVVSITKSKISVDAFPFAELPYTDTTFKMVVTAKESPLLVNSDSDWLRIEDVNADGSYQIHADANPRTAKRKASISIKGPTALKSIEITQAGSPATGASVTEIISQEDGSVVQTLPNTIVVALTTRGAVLSDGTNAIYAYGDLAAALKVGDGVKMSATKTTYNGVPELATITDVFVDSQGNAVNYPEAKDITSAVTTYSASTAEFIKFNGTLAVSGNYYNITFDNVDSDTKQGSIVYPVESLGAKSWDGKKITVTGFYNGLSGKDKYVNIIATKIVEYVDNPKGTLSNPYSPSEIAALLLGGTTIDEDVYIKGIVSSILYTFNADKGTGTFWLSDDGAASGISDDRKTTTDPAHDFECYSVYWLGNQPWADGNAQLAVGDEVIVHGKTTVYNGVAETSSKKASIFSVNTATSDNNGVGNASFPFNNAGIHAFIDYVTAATAAATEAGVAAPVFPDVCVKGKVSAVLYTFNADKGTGTFWISDDGTAHGISEDKKSTTDTVNDFECYSVYWLGNHPWVDGNDQVAVGDEVIVKGQYTIYKGTYETSSKKAWLYSLNGNIE